LRARLKAAVHLPFNRAG